MSVFLRKRKGGFTLIEIMIVVGIIIILAVIAVPAFNRARLRSMRASCLNNLRLRASCLNNLRLIDGAADLYALETGSAPGGLGDLDGEYIKSEPVCPAGGDYAEATISDLTITVTCSKAAAPDLHVFEVE